MFSSLTPSLNSTITEQWSHELLIHIWIKGVKLYSNTSMYNEFPLNFIKFNHSTSTSKFVRECLMFIFCLLSLWKIIHVWQIKFVYPRKSTLSSFRRYFQLIIERKCMEIFLSTHLIFSAVYFHAIITILVSLFLINFPNCFHCIQRWFDKMNFPLSSY